MKKVLRIFLLFIFMVTITGERITEKAEAAVFEEDASFTMSYVIKLNNTLQGSFIVEKINNTFNSRYYSISINDRIPFFASQKSGEMINQLKATKISFDDKKYKIYNDLENEAPENLPAFMKANMDKRSVLVDEQTNRVELHFEKIPMVTFENMLIGFIYSRIQANQPMMLYEKVNDIKFKVFFEEKGTEPVVIGNDNCTATVYRCMRQNVPGEDPVFLFNVYIGNNNVPLKIASSRWAFEIEKIGKIKLIKEDISKYCEAESEKKVNSMFQAAYMRDIGFSDINIYKGNFKNNIYNYSYTTEMKIIPGNKNEPEVLNYFCDKYGMGACGRDSSVVLKTNYNHKSGYAVIASAKEIRQELMNSNIKCSDDTCVFVDRKRTVRVPFADIIEFAQKYYGKKIEVAKKKDGLLNKVFKNHDQLVFSDNREELKIEDAVKAYLSIKNPNDKVKYENHLLNEGYEMIETRSEVGGHKFSKYKRSDQKSIQSINVSFSEYEPISTNEKKRAAKSVISNKIGKNYNRHNKYGSYHNFSKKDFSLLEKNGGYMIYVEKSTIDQRIAEKRRKLYIQWKTSRKIENLDIEKIDNNGRYLLSGNDSLDTKTIEDQILNQLLKRKSSYFKYNCDKLKKNGQYWIYPEFDKRSEIELCQ